MTDSSTTASDQNFKSINPAGRSPVVLVCEHASNHFPPDLNALGLDAEAANSHAAWDPGALPVATVLSRRLDAPLAMTTHSRLIYDCNRPPSSPDAMIAVSEKFSVPGNQNLTATEREARVKTYYEPFRQGLSALLARHGAPILVTIHSFTRVYLGKVRDTDIGILHDADARVADAMLETAADHTDLRVRRNDPYGPEDGVTHTLKEHGIRHDRPNVMIEIRSDLIATEDAQRDMAGMLGKWLAHALKEAGITSEVVCSA